MKYSVSNYDLIYSMDVDATTICLAVLDKKLLKQTKSLPYDPANLVNYVRKHFPGQKGLFLYEAGPTGYGLHDYLKEKGEDCVVAVPSMIPKAPGQRVKTNGLDAYRLGIQARTDDLKLVEVPEKKYRDLRHLTRLRLYYSKRIVATKNALRGLYLFEGNQFPEGNWSRRLISEIKQISNRPAVDFKVKQLVTNLEFFRTQELKTKAEIRRFSRGDEEINNCVFYLMSLPGVGWIVSTYVLGALGGYKHLISVKSTSGFLGFGPRENSTGPKIRKGEITAVGDPNARKMIIQASWVGIKKDPDLRSDFDKVRLRHNKEIARKKAIVAVGRKVICRMHAVLRDQRLFEKRLITKVA
jgi:transposase